MKPAPTSHTILCNMAQQFQSYLDRIGKFGCVPPFTRGILGHELGLALGRALRRLSRITPDRYALRSLSMGTSVVIKESGWRLPCRCSFSRLSRNSTRTPLWARLSKTARRLFSLIYANSTFNVRWGRLRLYVGVKSPTTSIFMNSRRSTIR